MALMRVLLPTPTFPSTNMLMDVSVGLCRMDILVLAPMSKKNTNKLWIISHIQWCLAFASNDVGITSTTF